MRDAAPVEARRAPASPLLVVITAFLAITVAEALFVPAGVVVAVLVLVAAKRTPGLSRWTFVALGVLLVSAASLTFEYAGYSTGGPAGHLKPVNIPSAPVQ